MQRWLLVKHVISQFSRVSSRVHTKNMQVTRGIFDRMPLGSIAFDGITSDLVLCILIVLTTVFSMAWCKQLCNTLSWYTMELPTCDLYFLGIQTRLKVYRENTSHRWDIARYITRKRSIISPYIIYKSCSNLACLRASQNTDQECLSTCKQNLTRVLVRLRAQISFIQT